MKMVYKSIRMLSECVPIVSPVCAQMGEQRVLNFSTE